MRLSGKVFAACGLWMILLGVYFVLLRPALRPEDPRFMGTTIEALRATVPGLEGWLGHVFNVIGRFMIAAGAMTILTASQFLAQRVPGTFLALAVAGTSSLVVMSATNFQLHSDFRWLLLVPALLWVIGLVCYLIEKTADGSRSETN